MVLYAYTAQPFCTSAKYLFSHRPGKKAVDSTSNKKNNKREIGSIGFDPTPFFRINRKKMKKKIAILIAGQDGNQVKGWPQSSLFFSIKGLTLRS